MGRYETSLVEISKIGLCYSKEAARRDSMWDWSNDIVVWVAFLQRREYSELIN